MMISDEIPVILTDEGKCHLASPTGVRQYIQREVLQDKTSSEW